MASPELIGYTLNTNIANVPRIIRRKSALRILMLLNAYEKDGPGNLVKALVSAMRFEPGVDIHTAALARGGPMIEEYAALQIPTQNFEMTSWFDWKVVNRLKDWMRERQFDVVHTHLLRPDLIGRVAARFCGVPCVVSTEHGVHAWGEKGWALEPFVATLYRATSANAVDRIVAISEAVREDLAGRGIVPEKISIISNGIDLNVFAPPLPSKRAEMRALLGEEPDAARCFVAFVGNFIERKGARYFLDALPAVLERRPDVRPVLVGEGEEEAALRAQAKQLGLERRVAFIGKLAQKLPEFLGSIDALVVPSREEPFGLIAAEAMACMTPVIAFNVGGLGEIVEDGVSGRLVAPESVEGLTGAMLEMLEDDAARLAMGKAARERVKSNYDIDKQALKYLALYRGILDTKTTGPATPQ